MPKTTTEFIKSIFESVSDSHYTQNKKHHGNTKLELESAPHKVAKTPYKGPIKKVPTVREEHSLKPKSEADKLARTTKTTNRPDTKKWAANKLVAMGKIHYKHGKRRPGPEPE